MTEIQKRNETDFDEIKAVHGNESYYCFDLLNHIDLSKDKESNAILTDDEDNNLKNIMLNLLYAFSCDCDSNDQSKELVNAYRKSVSV